MEKETDPDNQPQRLEFDITDPTPPPDRISSCEDIMRVLQSHARLLETHERHFLSFSQKIDDVLSDLKAVAANTDLIRKDQITHNERISSVERKIDRLPCNNWDDRCPDGDNFRGHTPSTSLKSVASLTDKPTDDKVAK